MAMLQMTWLPLKRKPGSPPLGLRNLGNTCYLNSVLQCLTYTPPLANFCLRYLHSSVCDSRKEKGECPFCILERRIALSLSSEAVADAPLKINRCLRVYADHFHAGRQEDAHEFLRYVIDACHNKCLKLKKLQQHQLRGKTGSASRGDISGCTETVFKQIFGGALQSQVKCLSCGAESNKIDEIMDISLDILHSESLKEALQKFFQPEVLDGNNKYKCGHCERLVAARKQMTFLQAPNVLVIQLKRFECVFGGKVDKPIAFDETLVLSSHMCKGSKVTSISGYEYEVVDNETQHVVNVTDKICMYGVWQIDDFPRRHAMASFSTTRSDQYAYVSKYYTKESYKSTYEDNVYPPGVNTFDAGESSDLFENIHPPQAKRQRERPRKSRLRPVLEKIVKHSQCENYGQCGHNKCKCRN